MTAMFDEEFMQSSITENDPHPSSSYYGDFSDLRADQYHCQTSLQQHICSSYCLKRSKIKQKGHWCNKTCTFEKTPGKGDTPGYPIIQTPVVIRDTRGYMRLDLPHNHPRIVQKYIFVTRLAGQC